MNTTFTPLRDQDFALVKSIYDAYILNSTATFHTEPITELQLKEFIYTGHDKYKSYLIHHEGALAGYCYLAPYRNRQAYDRSAEITVYLTEASTGKGIGRKAIQYLEDHAIAIGLHNLLATISGENYVSIKVFSDMGYTKCAHFKNIGEKFGRVLDVVILQKEI